MATEAQPTVGEELAKLVTYVVQVREEILDRDDGHIVWRDFSTVSVPPRSKRKTVVEKALAQARGLRPSGPSDEPLMVRVLGPEDARAFKVSAVVRDPELRIEGA